MLSEARYFEEVAQYTRECEEHVNFTVGGAQSALTLGTLGMVGGSSKQPEKNVVKGNGCFIGEFGRIWKRLEIA